MRVRPCLSRRLPLRQVFPASEAVVATWDNLMDLIHREYGAEVHGRLTPFLDQVSGSGVTVVHHTVGSCFRIN